MTRFKHEMWRGNGQDCTLLLLVCSWVPWSGDAEEAGEGGLCAGGTATGGKQSCGCARQVARGAGAQQRGTQ